MVLLPTEMVAPLELRPQESKIKLLGEAESVTPERVLLLTGCPEVVEKVVKEPEVQLVACCCRL